jgi:hypothetical protein
MDEPVQVQSQRVETTTTTQSPPPVEYAAAPAPLAPVPPAAPVAASVTRHAVATSSTSIPPAYRARQGVWLALIVVDIILALRFLFYALGANDVGFASAMYRIGSALDAPFRGIFSTTLDPSGHPLQWADLLAIAVYALAAWLVTKVILLFSTRSQGAPTY